MLNPVLWNEAKRIFDDALAAPPEARTDLVRAACERSPALRAEVESLLAWHDDSTTFLETPAGHVAALPYSRETDPLVGQSLGAWRIVGIIGRGGMGMVYRAARADDAFRRDAALKVVRRGAQSFEMVARFKRERETLAALDHPSIARVLDGGSTPSGDPYLVMEYVDGVRVDTYCDRAHLSIDERLRLFRAICRGVQHAHQNLVVHRDLKPDNILVTNDGVPKLLDFGIATLLSDRRPAGAEVSNGEHTWLLTPDFASPEQLSGGAVTTASDVYSLGVLLHLLLTGERPYRLTGQSTDALREELAALRMRPPSRRVAAGTPGAIERAAVRGATPTALARRLSGDLDAIVARATARQPEARYPTVDQLIDDLDRHAARQPVSARPPALAYVVGRFVRRNLVPLSAAAVIVVLAAAGVAGIVWQARLAADARTRAERRFADVRRLAQAFMFDVYDEVSCLPGATRARERMVRIASDYLQSLGRESAGDLGLQRELAAAFVRLGDAQGHPNSPSLGQTAAARASYEEAIRISRAILDVTPADAEAERTLALAYRRHANVLAWTGETAAALYESGLSRAIFQRLKARSDATPGDRVHAAVADMKLADLLTSPNDRVPARNDEALQLYEHARAALQQELAADPDNVRTRRYVGLAFERIGTWHEQRRAFEAAAEAYAASFRVRQQLAEAQPMQGYVQRDLAIAYEKMAGVRAFRGDLAGAAESYFGALAQFQRLSRGDPSNATARRSVATARERLARTLLQLDRPDEAIRQYTAALRIHRDLGARDAENVQARCDTGRLEQLLGDLAGSQEAACSWWRASLASRVATRGISCASSEEMARLSAKLRRCQ